MRIMRSKELPEELRDGIVARHRSGQGYKKISAALKVPKSTVASIILKWKTFGMTRTLPRAGQTELSGEKSPKITVAELQSRGLHRGPEDPGLLLRVPGLFNIVCNTRVDRRTPHLPVISVSWHFMCVL